MSYKINQPYWSNNPPEGKGVRLSWTWPPSDFIAAADPLFSVLYVQRSTSSDIRVNGHWPLSPDFVKDVSTQFEPTPETGWETIKVINVPPQFMTNTAPTIAADLVQWNLSRSCIDPIDAPNQDVWYRIVGFVKVDVTPDRYFEWDWSPAVLTIAPGGSGSWANVYGESTAGGTSVATDSSGNIYVTGYFRNTMSLGSTGTLTNSSGGASMFIMKLTVTGAIVWAKAYGGIGTINPKRIRIDSAGNILIGGAFYQTVSFGGASRTSAGDADAFIVKYDSSGNYTWDVVFGANFPDVVNDLETDSSNNVFATGFIQGNFTIQGTSVFTWGTGIDVFLAKFNSSGVLQFFRNYYNAGTEYGNGLIIDSVASGENVYLSGYFNGYINFSGGQADANLLSGGGGYIAKFNNSGTWIWSKKYGSTEQSTRFWASVLDASENIVVAGDFQLHTDIGGGNMNAAGWTADGFIAKYSSVNGAWQTTRQLLGFQASNFRPNCLARDVADNIVLTGYMARYMNCGNGVVLDITPAANRGFAAKFSPALVAQWAHAFTGPNISDLLGCASSILSPVVTGYYAGNETFAGKNLSGNQHAALMLLSS